jgi:hypothetical protein
VRAVPSSSGIAMFFGRPAAKDVAAGPPAHETAACSVTTPTARAAEERALPEIHEPGMARLERAVSLLSMPDSLLRSR